MGEVLNYIWSYRIVIHYLSKNQTFMMNVKGIRNFILGTGAEVNYGISRGIWTFAHSRQCFKNFYKLYFGTAVTSKMFKVFSFISYNIFVFTAVALISVKVIMTYYRSYSILTRINYIEVWNTALSFIFLMLR